MNTTKCDNRYDANFVVTDGTDALADHEVGMKMLDLQTYVDLST